MDVDSGDPPGMGEVVDSTPVKRSVSRRARWTAAAIGLVVAALGGAFSVTAGADTRGEPAALAKKGMLRVTKGRGIEAFAAAKKERKVGKLRGNNFESGKKPGRRGRLGGGKRFLRR
jgi:hypothetical protein